MISRATLRDARVEDAPVLVEAEQTIASRPGFLASRPEELLEVNFRSMIEKLTGRDDGEYLVAESQGRLLGHALLVPMALAATRRIVRLTIVVHPGNEGQGIGKRPHLLPIATSPVSSAAVSAREAFSSELSFA